MRAVTETLWNMSALVDQVHFTKKRFQKSLILLWPQATVIIGPPENIIHSTISRKRNQSTVFIRHSLEEAKYNLEEDCENVLLITLNVYILDFFVKH